MFETFKEYVIVYSGKLSSQDERILKFCSLPKPSVERGTLPKLSRDGIKRTSTFREQIEYLKNSSEDKRTPKCGTLTQPS